MTDAPAIGRETIVDDPGGFRCLFARLRLGPHANLVYLVADPSSRQAACIDPAFDVPRIQTILARWDATLVAILQTHGHWDHVEGSAALAAETGAAIYIHAADAPALEDTGLTVERLQGGERIALGRLEVIAHATPGHTAGGLTYQAKKMLFTGDLLFTETAGRCDFPTGSRERMWETLQWLKATFADDHVICPGHDYGAAPSTTMGEARRTNAALRHTGFGAFAKEWFLKAY